jgi:hypothetical protein
MGSPRNPPELLTDPRARTPTRRRGLAAQRTSYRLADAQRDTILIACSKCDWKAAFDRGELVATHGGDRLLPDLLKDLAKPRWAQSRESWDHCGAHYLEPIGRARGA